MYSVETLTRSHLLERPLCVLTFRFSFIAFHAFSVNTPKVEPLEHEGLPRRTPNYWRPTPLLYT